ncbi:MAG: STAS domain-containing protein [Spirochaetota bacterium]
MDYTVKENETSCIYILNKQLNPRKLKEFIEVLNNFLQNDTRDAILDLSSIEIVDSTILAGFMSLYNNFNEQNRSFKIINPNPAIRRIIEIASLEVFLLEE